MQMILGMYPNHILQPGTCKHDTSPERPQILYAIHNQDEEQRYVCI